MAREPRAGEAASHPLLAVSTPIPEPGTGFLIGTGLTGLAILKRRIPARKKRVLARLEVDGLGIARERFRGRLDPSELSGRRLASTSGSSEEPVLKIRSLTRSAKQTALPAISPNGLEADREERRRFRRFAAGGPWEVEAETAVMWASHR